MSQRRERIEERYPAAGPVFNGLERVFGVLESQYHVVVLAALMAFMLWIRVRDWSRFVVGGQVLFRGNDPWYHFREVNYTVRHWPFTMPFDPWTQFPIGTFVGQFGTIYDQLVATTALIVGLGSPDSHTIGLALLFAPAVLGTLVALPTYAIGKRFGGRLGGLLAVAVLALTPGYFLNRTVAGVSDHNAAEVFFQVLAVAGLLVALAVAEREKPVYEQFVDRDWRGVRRPVGWGILAGIALTLYIWTWPPGVLLLGVIGIFFVIALTLLYVRGESPDHVAIAGAVAMVAAGLSMLIRFQTFEVTATTVSLLQPGLAFLIAVGCVFLAWLARTWDARSVSKWGYPVTVGVIVVALIALVAVVTPDLFSYGVGQLKRVVGFGISAKAGTVGEAQPPIQLKTPDGSYKHLGKILDLATNYLAGTYGLAIYTAIAGALVMLGRAVFGSDDENRAGYLLVVVWAALMVMATFTQSRFSYYLFVPVAVLNGFLLGQVIVFLNATDARSVVADLDAYQVLAAVALILVVTAPLVAAGGQNDFTAGQYADAVSHTGNGIRGWDGSLQWMNTSTPAEGTYGGAENRMEYYGNYHRTDDFDYPEGAYGVMSWWDYGHWITTLGHRIPVANPFQQQATHAANYLLATNETTANDRLATEGSGTRYVMIDWKMADPGVGSRQKFFAPIVWTDANDTAHKASKYRASIGSINQNGQFQRRFMAPNQRYYESMVTRLYEYHGSAIDAAPIVLDYAQSGTNDDGSLAYATVPTGQNATPVKRFDNISAARAFVEQDGSARIGGVGRYPEKSVPALQHYRLVHGSRENPLSGRGPLFNSALRRARATGLGLNQLFATSQNWVKTFSRVPGANVSGTGPANQTVTASVEMKMTTTNRTFTYTQHAETDQNGEFNMTLPYSTTGYDNWGTKKGYTNVSVRATGPYTIQSDVLDRNRSSVTVAQANLSVPEGTVLGENESTLSADLENRTVAIPQANNSTNATANATATNATAANTTAANATTANATNATNSTTANATNSTTANATTATASALSPPRLARVATVSASVKRGSTGVSTGRTG